MSLFSIFYKRSGRKKISKNLSSSQAGNDSSRFNKKVEARIHVGQLRVGMYVSGLDKPWLETPFVTQGFYIKSERDIDEICKHCDYVYVDALQELSTTGPGAGSTKGLRTRFIHKLPNSKEWGETEATYKHAQTLTKSILDEVRLGSAINQKKVRGVVTDCVDSILANASTMVWVSQMAEKHAGLERHALSVCVLAIAFGRYIGYSRDSLEKLGASALLHDVGKLKLPEGLLRKIHLPVILDDLEVKEVKKHVAYGRDVLMSSSLHWGAVDVAYAHHERYDGTGYPRGLKAEAIPVFAQIVALADTFDALTAKHSYKATVSSLDALKIIYKQKGKQFDPKLTDSFIRFVSIYPPGAIVQLKMGDIGIVVDRNHTHKHLPRVLLLRNSKGEPVRPQLISLMDFYRKTGGDRFLICRMYPSGSFGIHPESFVEKGMISR